MISRSLKFTGIVRVEMSRSFSDGKFMKRYDVVPETLYRMNPSASIKLRSYEQRIAAGMQGNFSYDLHERDGLVHPVTGDTFTGPNGMSLRPKSQEQKDLVLNYAGKLKVFVLPAGLKIPSNLVLIHEHTNHYSMQVREPMTFTEFNSILSAFLKSLNTISRDEFLELFEDEDEDGEAIDN